MKDYKERLLKHDTLHTGNCNCNIDPNCKYEERLIDFIEQIISERDKEWDKWKVLAEAMDNAPVGHRVTIKHLLGEDEWTLTRRNK